MRTIAIVVLVGGLGACGTDGGMAGESDGATATAASSWDSGGDASESSPSGGSDASSGDVDPNNGSATDDPSGDPTGDPSGDPTGETGDPLGGPHCDPLPAPDGAVIELAPTDDLAAAIAEAPAGSTLLLADGTYDVSGAGYIALVEDGVTIRSASGDPSTVVIDGGYALGEVFSIAADDITIAEVTIQRALHHPIHVTGGPDSNTENTLVYRVRVVDPGQQAIKINALDGTYADFGTIACSHLELTAEGRPHVTDCYTGGIDAHLAQGWTIRDNTITGFWCESGLSEHGVHVWNSGRDTVVERNTIIDCARGIGFGLGESGNGTSRDYGDDPCPGVTGFIGHYGGVIRNNAILGRDPAMFASQFGMDSGVALEQACGAVVTHNTVVALQPPFVGMEYRFANTQASIADNLVTHGITMRDGGTAVLEGNLVDVGTEHFVDAAAGDLHLVAGSSAIDAAVDVAGTEVVDDIDGDARDGTPDVGADEYVP
jgi:hypothetical protein